MTDYVFGYGSLVDAERLSRFLGRKAYLPADYQISTLHGYRRAWNIATDNRINLPSYKRYYEIDTGKRFEGYVSYLNVVPDADAAIIGLLFRVTSSELALLDLRERNYQRTACTPQIAPPVEGDVWLYVGLPAAELRFQVGAAMQQTVIWQEYYDRVEAAYRTLGETAFENYQTTTTPPIVPIRALRREQT